MGVVNSKDLFCRRTVDEACSNTSLSKLRYIAVEKPKWKVFGKRELKPIPTYNMRNKKGCHCGNAGPCKQKITPKGVIIHYPQKNIKERIGRKYKPPKIEKAFLTDTNRVVNKVKIVRPKKFAIPTFRLDKIVHFSPFQNSINKRRRRGRFVRRRKPKPTVPLEVEETENIENIESDAQNINNINNPIINDPTVSNIHEIAPSVKEQKKAQRLERKAQKAKNKGK